MSLLVGGAAENRTLDRLLTGSRVQTGVLVHAGPTPFSISRLVCWQLAVTIAAHEPEILYPVVVIDTVDMIQDQRHWLATPLWSKTAHGTLILKQLLSNQPLLQTDPSICAVLD